MMMAVVGQSVGFVGGCRLDWHFLWLFLLVRCCVVCCLELEELDSGEHLSVCFVFSCGDSFPKISVLKLILASSIKI